MKRIFWGVLCTLVFGAVAISSTNLAQAATINYNNIIDNAVFDNSNSMTAAQIDAFLNSFPSSCISTKNGFKSPDPTGYNPSQGFLFGGNVSAGTVIYHAARAYDLNPQVLLATLQKEQSLVTGTAGCYPNTPDPTVTYRCALYGGTTQYNCTHACPYGGGCIPIAVGYGCPGACNAAQEGFSNQIIRAAWRLTFDRHRAEGQVNWYIDKPGWDNSDDPQSCYSGPMTQGTLSRGPSTCGSGYFDGYYTTNDPATVHIDNGATAALYHYTPFKHGQSLFFNTFTNWFGSTRFPQPVGASLYRQSSNGRIYLATTNDDGSETRFYIPSPAIMDNFGLSSYGTIPADDTTIQSIADGGTLSNAIRDISGKIYLVNNGSMYHITGPSLCTAWGIDCFNSNVVHTLGDIFETSFLKPAGALPLTVTYQGDYYKMDAGQRLPFANVKSLTDSGYSTSGSLAVHASNVTQPLGKLIVTTPGIIKFAPKTTLYYFSGTQYFAIQDMNIYKAWGMGGVTALSAPKSSYNDAEEVSSSPLSYWAVDSGGKKYAITGGGIKLQLDTDQQNLWPDATYAEGMDSLLGKLSTKPLGSFIKNGINFYRLNLTSAKKQYIASMDDYLGLGGNSSNTTRLNDPLTGLIPSGPFAFTDGRLIKVQGDTTIYVMNQSALSHVSSMSVLRAYNFNTSNMKIYPVSAISEYTIAGALRHGKLSDGSAVLSYDNHLVTLTADQVTDFGLDSSHFTTVSQTLTSRASKVAATKFFRDSTTGRIYYANGGGIHYVGSMNTLRQLGGDKVPLTSVDTSIIDLFTLKEPA